MNNCLKNLVKNEDMLKAFKDYIKQKYKSGQIDKSIRPSSWPNYNRLLNMIKQGRTTGDKAFDKYLREDLEMFLYDKAIEDYSKFFKDIYNENPALMGLYPDGRIPLLTDNEGLSISDKRAEFGNIGLDLLHYLGSFITSIPVPVVVVCMSSVYVQGSK
jgi:hypothetical protein